MTATAQASAAERDERHAHPISPTYQDIVIGLVY